MHRSIAAWGWGPCILPRPLRITRFLLLHHRGRGPLFPHRAPYSLHRHRGATGFAYTCSVPSNSPYSRDIMELRKAIPGDPAILTILLSLLHPTGGQFAPEYTGLLTAGILL